MAKKRTVILGYGKSHQRYEAGIQLMNTSVSLCKKIANLDVDAAAAHTKILRADLKARKFAILARGKN